jgi:hypothetical protein
MDRLHRSINAAYLGTADPEMIPKAANLAKATRLSSGEGSPRRGRRASIKLGLPPLCLLCRDRALLVEALGESLGMVERVAVDLERPQHRKPNVCEEALGGDEAEAAFDGSVLTHVGKCSPDVGDLPSGGHR